VWILRGKAPIADKLWEVSDIVEMLEQWELANFKPESGRVSPVRNWEGTLCQHHVARRGSRFD
jgi:hypothetical protein